MRLTQKERIIKESKGKTVTMKDGRVYTDTRTMVKLKGKDRS